MRIFDRHKQVYMNVDEKGDNQLKFLYNTKFGRTLLKIATSSSFSTLYSKYKKSVVSKLSIKSFIKENHINLDEYENIDFQCINDVFIRKKKKECLNIDMNTSSFISPADAKLRVYKIADTDCVKIKGVKYTVNELVDDNLEESFKNGYCLVFRLSMGDYHRYCFVDNAKIIKRKSIDGQLHTIRPIASKYSIYRTNKRKWELMRTENFGNVLQMEVGAMFVGEINNSEKNDVKKGEEKGYFSIGGSTIVVLVNNIILDEDIMIWSNEGVECVVNYGERIGEKCLKD